MSEITGEVDAIISIVQSTLTKHQQNAQNIIQKATSASQTIKYKQLMEIVEETFQSKTTSVFDSFEPSIECLNMNIDVLIKILNAQKLISAGCKYTFCITDWLSMLNDDQKYDNYLDMNDIKIIAKYMLEIWKCFGIHSNINNFSILWNSDLINKNCNQYWLKTIQISKLFNIATIKQLQSSLNDSSKTSCLLSQCIKCCNIIYLKSDVALINENDKNLRILTSKYGKFCKYKHFIDTFIKVYSTFTITFREKTIFLITEYIDIAHINTNNDYKIPIITLNDKLLCLQYRNDNIFQQNHIHSNKCCIFINDKESVIKKKIKKAYCLSGEIKNNPLLNYVKCLIFNVFDSFEINDKVYGSYKELENDFKMKILHPKDLKNKLTEKIIAMLLPIRNHFQINCAANKLFERINCIQIDAMIIMIMKKRKKFKFTALVGEVKRQLEWKYCAPTQKEIQNRIAELIELEYIIKDVKNKNICRYYATI